MQTIDLYSDYEGYAEVVLTEETSSDEIILKVQLLGFHFDEILSLIPFGEYDPDSVINNYFKASGWHDGKWECKRIQEFYDQLVKLNDAVPLNYLNILNALKQICSSSLQNKNKLFIDLC
ncbi:hypothetical protein SAMN05216464_102125 [Mucilaginibacter pineti]|uniref:Uncharacterized protein n=1 Tax=Mucilaginibacter pineti TaxID=1391627 RepID=A0A1G6WDV9_9SPHI|nr:hypothetical protein [Mucilaginibacter pineti]SDD63265.1 hypothetical protein SAMN05216464_102125 [Mucilaginibacter pineti]